jgi:hypothetical protein
MTHDDDWCGILRDVRFAPFTSYLNELSVLSGQQAGQCYQHFEIIGTSIRAFRNS